MGDDDDDVANVFTLLSLSLSQRINRPMKFYQGTRKTGVVDGSQYTVERLIKVLIERNRANGNRYFVNGPRYRHTFRLSSINFSDA